MPTLDGYGKNWVRCRRKKRKRIRSKRGCGRKEKEIKGKGEEINIVEG